jgi:hypothetical protein
MSILKPVRMLGALTILVSVPLIAANAQMQAPAPSEPATPPAASKPETAPLPQTSPVQKPTTTPRPDKSTSAPANPLLGLAAFSADGRRPGTCTVLFTPHSSAGFVQRDQEVFDQLGRRSVRPVRTYMERKGFVLRPKFVFIDGRTGATMYSESYREEILYSGQQNTPALSSYFELMDRLVPNFLSALSSQKIKGTRVLLK